MNLQSFFSLQQKHIPNFVLTFVTHSECTETKCVISKVGKPAYEWGKNAAVNQIKNYIDGKLLEIAWIFTL